MWSLRECASGLVMRVVTFHNNSVWRLRNCVDRAHGEAALIFVFLILTRARFCQRWIIVVSLRNRWIIVVVRARCSMSFLLAICTWTIVFQSLLILYIIFRYVVVSGMLQFWSNLLVSSLLFPGLIWMIQARSQSRHCSILIVIISYPDAFSTLILRRYRVFLTEKVSIIFSSLRSLDGDSRLQALIDVVVHSLFTNERILLLKLINKTILSTTPRLLTNLIH